MEQPAPHDVDTVRALLFDLGGVLIDIDFRRALAGWAARAGTDPDELGRRFTFDAAYERHERGELDAAGYFASLRDTLDLPLSDDELVAGWNDIWVGLVPGMTEVLASASRRWPLYALTNSNPTHQREWSRRFAPELSVFRAVFVSSDLGRRKPEAEAFTAVAGRIGLEPGEILFFDDSPENVEGARRVGMPAVLVATSADVRAALHGLVPDTGEGTTT